MITDPPEGEDYSPTFIYSVGSGFILLGIWGFFSTIKNWKRPYVRFEEDLIILRQERSPQYIPKSRIESFSFGLQSTKFRTTDGFSFRISHVPFLTSSVVKEFQAALTNYLGFEPDASRQSNPSSRPLEN